MSIKTYDAFVVHIQKQVPPMFLMGLQVVMLTASGMKKSAKIQLQQHHKLMCYDHLLVLDLQLVKNFDNQKEPQLLPKLNHEVVMPLMNNVEVHDQMFQIL